MTDKLELKIEIDGAIRDFGFARNSSELADKIINVYKKFNTQNRPSQPLKDAELVEVIKNALLTSDFMRCDDAMNESTAYDHALRVTQVLKPHLGGGWLPIESAPKDGRFILGYDPERDSPAVIAWRKPEFRWKHLDYGSTEPEPEEIWRVEADEEFGFVPTLWKPLGDLPQPPSEVS